ncbi:MAG: hypothetical protein ISS28_02375 [Candidatus Cloacimonetes bacterium]|nr:hypothetical protein [Candidatus Cloacimonadota bacterium]
MPKNIFFESSIYHLLVNTKKLVMETEKQQKCWLVFLDSLQFSAKNKRSLHIDWEYNNKTGALQLDFTDVIYYKKGNKIDKDQIIRQNNKIFTMNAIVLKSTFESVLNE